MKKIAVTVAMSAISVAVATAQNTGTDKAALEKRVAELEKKLGALEEQNEASAFPELAGGPLKSVWGHGAAASKVYHVPAGVSLGGYGEALATFDDDKTDTSDFLRAILYAGYKFDDKWVLNTEIEFEHASTGKSGEASVEFATLDYLARPEFNLRFGLLLAPVGLVNELHEPNTFLPVGRSKTESVIIPSTWRENGAGVFGEVGMVRYKAYVLNGLKGEGFAAKGLRGGRQKGSRSESEDWAGVLRVDFVPSQDTMVGGSVYHGNSGQALDLDVTTTIAEIHADLQLEALKLRALGAVAEVDDTAALSRLNATDEAGVVPADSTIDAVGESMVGWYVEAGYDLFHAADRGEQALIPFIRYEEVNTKKRNDI